MENAKPYASPVLAGKKLLPFDGDPLPDPTTYRSVVGALQYLTLTRPNMAFVVSQMQIMLGAPQIVDLLVDIASTLVIMLFPGVRRSNRL
ncbi:hypothetical protein AAC387_Pa03g1976 [Persea americana]